MLASAPIKEKAQELGFDLVGMTGAECLASEHIRHLQAWLQAGYAGEMTYMQRHLEKRTDPGKLLKGAQSAIVVGLNYKPPTGERLAPCPGQGSVANYACYQDYHDFIKSRLFALADFIQAGTTTAVAFKACVDSVPLAERSLAVRAGLGFIGKNHMLIHPDMGQEIFLGELITTLPLQQDCPCTADCGQCQRCVTACPTGALQADGQLNARRCINYLTIEHRGDIHPDLGNLIGQRVYGCDTCIEACPRQQHAPACQNKAFRYYPERRLLDLQACLSWDESTFRQAFAGSPVQRIGLAQLQRNARICLANRSG